MNRRSIIALASAVSIAVWQKPILNSVVLPAHAQTSCSSIQEVDIVGNWLFTDAVGNTVEIEFINEDTLRIDGRTTTDTYDRAPDGALILNVRNPMAPWQATITQESDCLASEITVSDARGDEIEFTNAPFTVPLVGVRI